MNFLKCSFFFTLFFLLQSPLNAQDWSSHQSQRQINDLIDTGTELIMATDAGLVVLNKSTLDKTIFHKANTSLHNAKVISITEAPDGTVWVGTKHAVLSLSLIHI